MDGAARNISLVITPLGPLIAGFLLDNTTPRATVAVFAACGLVLALWGTLSPAMRQAPSLAELDDLPEPPPAPPAEPAEAPL